MPFCASWGFSLYVTATWLFNSLVPGGFHYSLKLVNFKFISTINILSIFCEIAIRWMPQHLTDHKSTLIQVMAWCRQATSHYLSQCWHRSMLPYDVTRPQWVKQLWRQAKPHKQCPLQAISSKPGCHGCHSDLYQYMLYLCTQYGFCKVRIRNTRHEDTSCSASVLWGLYYCVTICRPFGGCFC